MSIRLGIADSLDRLNLKLQSNFRKDRLEQVILTPVFHVEQLHVDSYYSSLKEFLRFYRDVTGVRAVVTSMTPHSPILAAQLKSAGFAEDRYWKRLAGIAEHGLMGLHGHFVRYFQDDYPVPMHCSFFDLAKIKVQIATELKAMREHDLMTSELLIYSGGWWFTSKELRDFLGQNGFHWDYSISTSPYNISPGSQVAEIHRNDEGSYYLASGRKIRTSLAACGLSKQRRAFQSIGKILDQHKKSDAAEAPTYLSLYSHDYDLDLPSAMNMVRTYSDVGLKFSEPT